MPQTLIQEVARRRPVVREVSRAEELVRKVLYRPPRSKYEAIEELHIIINSTPEILQNLIALINKYASYRRSLVKKRIVKGVDRLLFNDVVRYVVGPALAIYERRYKKLPFTPNDVEAIAKYYADVVGKVTALTKHALKYRTLWNLTLKGAPVPVAEAKEAR